MAKRITRYFNVYQVPGGWKWVGLNGGGHTSRASAKRAASWTKNPTNLTTTIVAYRLRVTLKEGETW